MASGAFRKYSVPSLFSHFLMLQPYAKIVKIIFFPYQSTLNRSWSQSRNRFFFFFLENALKRKKWYHIDISTQTLNTVLSWNTFGSDYSIEFSGVWHDKLCTYGFGDFLLFFRFSQALSSWIGTLVWLTFSCLSRDVPLDSSQGSGWTLKDIHRVVPEPTPALSWLCA